MKQLQTWSSPGQSVVQRLSMGVPFRNTPFQNMLPALSHTVCDISVSSKDDFTVPLMLCVCCRALLDRAKRSYERPRSSSPRGKTLSGCSSRPVLIYHIPHFTRRQARCIPTSAGQSKKARGVRTPRALPASFATDQSGQWLFSYQSRKSQFFSTKAARSSECWRVRRSASSVSRFSSASMIRR